VSTVRVTQVRSGIGQTRAHEGTLRALGLGRIGKSAEHEESPVLEGQLRHVAHLVTVTPLDGTGKDA
jgi:large subunit ribosomal protein L30